MQLIEQLEYHLRRTVNLYGHQLEQIKEKIDSDEGGQEEIENQLRLESRLYQCEDILSFIEGRKSC